MQVLPQFMTVEDLARVFETSTNAVQQWVSRGTAPRSFKVGRRRLFKPEDVLSWLEERASEPAGQ